MPTWFVCTKCRERFYTARHRSILAPDDRCQYCGGRLVLESNKRLLDTNLPVHLRMDEEAYRGEVASVSRERIALHPLETRLAGVAPGSACRVHFSRRAPGMQGRYRFATEVVAFERAPDPLLWLRYPADIQRIEERSSCRRAFQVPLDYQPAPSGSSRVGRTLNISNSGMLLEADLDDAGAVREGRELKLHFRLHELAVETRARVIWSREESTTGAMRIGVAFVGMHDFERKRIKHWVRWLGFLQVLVLFLSL